MPALCLTLFGMTFPCLFWASRRFSRQRILFQKALRKSYLLTDGNFSISSSFVREISLKKTGFAVSVYSGCFLKNYRSLRGSPCAPHSAHIFTLFSRLNSARTFGGKGIGNFMGEPAYSRRIISVFLYFWISLVVSKLTKNLTHGNHIL